MHADIMKKWVAALRSGDYKQGKGQLRKEVDGVNSFCCLGVLCNLHAMEHPEIAKNELSPRSYLGDSEYLPAQVQDWAGMKNNCGFYPR